MTLACARSVPVLVFAALLHACGGGSGNGGGNGGGGNSEPTLSVSPTNVSVSATPGDLPPPGAVTLTIENVPRDGLQLLAGFTSSGIENINFMQVSQNQGNVNIQFRAPGALQNGTYTDRIEIHVCRDEDCNRHIRGSPVTVRTSYEISGDGPTTASLDRDTILLTLEELEDFRRSETFRVLLDVVPESGTFWLFQHTGGSIDSLHMSRPSTSEADFNVVFDSSGELGVGEHYNTITVRACYDISCARQVRGSPLTVETRMIVGIGPEPGYEPLAVESRTALSHDIVDAEFSASLGQVVMVSQSPVNALYLYDAATGAEIQQPLSKVPTAVSVAPDGLTAAVGHDAQITVVDLVALAQPAPPAPVLLDVDLFVYDLVLDGVGNVHALGDLNGWGEIHSIAIAGNVEQLSTGSLIYAGSRGRLHPSGSYIYTAAHESISPGDVDKWDISTGRAEWLYDSPYHGEHGMCSDLWFHEGGARIYTACGNTFQSSTDPAEDIVYAGSLELSEGERQPFRLSHLSHSATQDELAAIEYDWSICNSIAATGPCYSHLALLDPDLLTRRAVYSIPPVTVAGQSYRQFGLFVFHDPASGKKVMLSRLRKMEDPAQAFYLSVIP